MRIAILLTVLVAACGACLSRYLKADAERKAVAKMIQDDKDRFEAQQLADSKKAYAEIRAGQDRTTKMLHRDHFDTPEQERASVAETVSRWLDGLRRGKEANWCWYLRDDVEPLRLYAVEDFEIVDWLGRERCVVRIHSHTQDGRPMVRLYIVTTRGFWIWSVEPRNP